MSKPTAISLFSGMGGDTLGLTQAGFDVIAFNEYEKAAIETHMANFPESKLICDPSQKKPKDRNDITKIPDAIFAEYKDKVDLIFAGHPCQGFSQGGKKLPDDPRNTLFREFSRVAKIVRPKFIIGENVDGLLSRKTANGENYFDVIVKEFNDLGYDIYHQVCHAVQYGIPQLRKRLVYVGVRNDLGKTFQFPSGLNDGKTNLPGLRDIVSFSMEGAIQIEPADFDMSSIPPQCILTDMDNEQSQDSNIHPYLTLKAKTRNSEYNGVVHNQTLSFAKRASPIHAEIVDIRYPSKTIICTYDHQPRLFVPLRNLYGLFLRPFSTNELKQIQGFPPHYLLRGNKKEQIKQIGNAVPPPLIHFISYKGILPLCEPLFTN